MQNLLDNLILYNASGDRVLELAAKAVSEDTDQKRKNACRMAIRALLNFAAEHGLSGNLWHGYVAYYIAADINPFSLEQERRTEEVVESTTAYELGFRDCQTLKKLFDWNMPEDSPMGACWREAVTKHKRSDSVKSDSGEVISQFISRLEAAKDEKEFFMETADFYRATGAGTVGINRGFTVTADGSGEASLKAVRNMENILLSDLVGYEVQKQKLTENTEAFLAGRPANNVLLYGDGGTGKSTSIRAISSMYWRQGLRIIQVYRHQMEYLGQIIELIKNRNYKFIIYMDDLSFEDFETEYKYLKAVIEGGLETRPKNVLIYATSNRRHLIKETWGDRSDMSHEGEIHRSDSTEEKLSLSERFGVQIYYGKPTKDQFHTIVEMLAVREKIDMALEKLHKEATKWEIRHGGVSGRSARQFIDYIKGTEEHFK